MCHHPQNCFAISSTFVSFDLSDHFIVSHSFLMVMITFGPLISWIIVSQYHACSLSISKSDNSSLS